MRHRTAASLLAALAVPPALGADPPTLVQAFAIDEIQTVGFNDFATGGLSGIEYLHGGQSFVPGDGNRPRTAPLELLVVSDDRAEFDPARLGTLTIGFRGDAIDPASATVHWGVLTDEFGARFATNRVDPEGVRVVPQTGLIYWSSEGRTEVGEPPAVFEIAPHGPVTRLPLPEAFIPDTSSKREQARGVRNNRGFEALAYTKFPIDNDRTARRLYAGVEEPLAQDESGARRLCRVVVYEPKPDEIDGPTRASMVPARTLLYPLGPVPDGWDETDNGLTELVALSPVRLLALERAERVVAGVPHYNVRLYWVAAEGAADVTEHPGLGGVAPDDLPPAMRKALLLDFDAIAADLPGGRAMNFEGMALLPDSRLLVVSDNDHGAEGPTVFAVLQIPAGLDQ